MIPTTSSTLLKALRDIGKKLGKKGWDFREDPCSGERSWLVEDSKKGFENSVVCDCPVSASASAVAVHGGLINLNNSIASGSTCHVTSISLKSQNLSGPLPPEFSRLRYLKKLELSKNVLSGTIPPQWATLRLVELYLMGNRLSGAFPKVLTNMSTLRNLSIEANEFSGRIPPEIGRMINMERLHINSNAFTGKLPVQLSKLANLTDIRISDNNFSGKIPDFISKLTKLEKLHIQGCSLEGPIPSSISALKRLTDLRISDLKGRGSSFPPLSTMDSMKTLVLRNCLLSGKIPEYLIKMKKMKTLDLSFNSLTGEIPVSFVLFAKVDIIYLTGNRLRGSIPQWLLERNKIVDVSYNNFTWESSGPTECPRGSVGRIHPCLRQKFPCCLSRKQYRYSLHINCGGKETSLNNTFYQADREPRGASMYYSSQNWAMSSTGHFVDNDLDADTYIQYNNSAISTPNNDSELYTTARGSPISLTYYGLCLGNGNYTVRLHFAEIVFTNDSSFFRVGKRIFDVYVQDKLVLKDFNIEAEAGGPGRPIVKTYTVAITNNTLKVHFYWAGRGTTGIPVRGVYGPLISAISVDPNFTPPSPEDNRRHIIIIAGAVSGALSFVLLILGILWRKGFLAGQAAEEKELRGLLDQQTGLFALRQIKAATKNFDPANKLGEGGFGCVYKGELPDGTVIAVKQLSAKSKQGNREFVTEVGMISGIQHPNMVKLYGCCVEGNQLILIYEYMENNCLSRALFAKDPACRLKLDWPSRQKICIGVARGLAYLHEESRIRVVHRDIKTSNVLLDKDLNPKISDFGLAKLHEDEDTHISTRVAGTIGYMAPEYAMRGCLTSKADVYSFGVVALEIVSGKSNTNYRPKEEYVYLLDWAYVLQERGCLLELVDPALDSEYSAEEVMLMLNVALLCTNASPSLRPTMSQVVGMLEGRTAIQDLLSDPGYSANRAKYKAIRNHFWQNPSRTHSMSTDDGYTDYSSRHIEIEESGSLLRAVSLKTED
ncbi:Probable LRR receptor-like serine/threonine-protein kinase At1g07650 [Linum grandiflorum]